ncbi:replication-relaxation family protein [Priestia koreensis]|uniref:replication-relaxation family protein n=1 Tax=Priestia koreensis TaxID=284581 RepID=UPI0030196637
MPYLLGYNLSPLSLNLIYQLFIYRGMTATQMASSLYTDQYLVSQEKSIYNYLGKLKKQQLVTSLRLQDSYSKGSIYYLTPKGYEFAKSWLDIQEGQRGTGWMKGARGQFADLSYELYRPPLSQTTHHLLLIDLFIRLNSLKMDGANYRLNLYASVTYNDGVKKQRYRPDGEIYLGNGRTYTIEIDRGTESHEQLRQKFKVYRQYFDYLTETKQNGIPFGILFVVEDKRRDHGIKRRWKNVAAAFFEEIGEYHEQVNLILTSLEMLPQTMRFEIQRQNYEAAAFRRIKKIINNSDFDSWDSHSLRYDDQLVEMGYSYGCKKAGYYLMLNFICQTYETRIYSRMINMWSIFQQKGIITTLRTPDIIQKNIFYDGSGAPYLIEELEQYDLSHEVKWAFKELAIYKKYKSLVSE